MAATDITVEAEKPLATESTVEAEKPSAEAEKPSAEAEKPSAAKANSNGYRTQAYEEAMGLMYSGKFAGGIRADIRRRAPWYVSDWLDGVKGGSKTVSATMFMFCACLAPGIAFGAYFDSHSGGKSGVMEYLITQSISGVIFAIISGQPLIILRPTGPITVFISQLYLIADSMGVEFLVAQFWTGFFVGLYMVLISVFDGCAAIRFCSRFTQDAFGCFVSVIFISMGIGNVVDKFTKTHVEYPATHQLLLTIGTLLIGLTLAKANTSKYFTKKMRETVADFAVPIVVLAFTLVANYLTVAWEPLPVPSKFGPTAPGRTWLVDVLPEENAATGVLLGLVAALPLVMLFFIDQNVTGLLTQHPDNNLKKGGAYHYNYMILGFFNMIFPLFGCPFVTGSLPHSPQFVNALAVKEVVRNGNSEKTVTKSVYENRVAPFLVNLLILACLPIIDKFQYIPTAVICDGLFLYMGISGLPGNQCFERFKMIFTDPALYPEMPWTVEEVPRAKMHFFTMVQVGVIAVLFTVAKSPIALAFPVFLIGSIPLRAYLHQISCGFISQEMVEILDGSRRAPTKDVEAAEATTTTKMVEEKTI
jgi:hypothetical protein